MSDQTTNSTPVQDENQIIAERRGKLAKLRESGPAFPIDFRRTHLAADLHGAHGDKSKEALEAEKPGPFVVAGRMLLKRVMGKASFATLQDMSGRIQVYVNNDGIGAEAHDAFKHWDLGDILGAEGTLFRTKTGELTLQVTKLRLLSKSLRPLPEKFHGLTDQEQKYRQRAPLPLCSVGPFPGDQKVRNRHLGYVELVVLEVAEKKLGGVNLDKIQFDVLRFDGPVDERIQTRVFRKSYCQLKHILLFAPRSRRARSPDPISAQRQLFNSNV